MSNILLIEFKTGTSNRSLSSTNLHERIFAHGYLDPLHVREGSEQAAVSLPCAGSSATPRVARPLPLRQYTAVGKIIRVLYSTHYNENT